METIHSMRRTATFIFMFLFLFCGRALADQQSLLEADTISIDDATGNVRAEGNVLITYGDDRVTGDQLNWIKSQKRIVVTGNVVFTQKDGTTSNAMAMELDEAMENWVISEIKSYLPKNARLQATEAARSSATQIALSDASYTACPECEEPDAAPIWQLRAKKVIKDEARQDIIYRHTRFEVFGVPIFYTPYLSHPAPEVERRSGFLSPSFTSQSDFGAGVTMPYHFAFAPNYDLTLAPNFTEKEGVVLDGTWRHLTRQGRYDINFFAHQPEGSLKTLDGDHNFRGGVISRGSFNTNGWQTEISVNAQSDDLFFRRYQISNADVLENRIDVSRYYGADYLNINARQFSNTLSNETTNTVDYILPDVTYIKRLDNAPLNGRMQLVNRASYSSRDLGVNVTKASSRLDWSYRHVSDGGFVWDIKNQTQIDGYLYDAQEASAYLPDSDTEVLAAETLGVMLAYPLVRHAETSQQTLKPTAQLVLASDNDRFDRVPHRIGAIFELNTNSLFGLAAPEDETSRLNYGLDYSLENNAGLRARFFAGQSYNLSNDAFSVASGFTDEASAVVTESEISYRGLMFTQNLRLDRDGGEVLRNQTGIEYAGSRLSVGADYAFLDTGQVANSIPREELSSRFAVRLFDNWHVGARMHQDLENNDRIRHDAHLTYHDDCTFIQLRFDRDYQQVGTIEPETQIELIFSLRTLGGNAAGANW